MTTATRKRRYEYRYRDHSEGVTRKSLEKMRLHLRKIGKPLVVRAYRFESRRSYLWWNSTEPRLSEIRYLTQNHEAVLVKGTHGTARFEGLCWGYTGEGPRGLRNLLLMLGVPIGMAYQLAFNKQRRDDHDYGTDWEYKVPAVCIPVWEL